MISPSKIEFNDRLYFLATNGESGQELHVSDGTAAGTQLLIDLYPGEDNNDYPNGSSPSFFVEYDEKLYFTANDGESGRELFVSDGTAEGTQLLVDLNPDDRDNVYTYRYSPTAPVEFNEKLYFTANDGESGRELFVSDGTAEGTQLLVDLNPDSSGNRYSDDSNPSNFIVFNDKLYFTANDPQNGSELFVSDGTAAGTQLAFDLNPGSSGSNPNNLVEFNGKLYFTANDSQSGAEIYATDGTAEGTQLVAEIDVDSSESDAVSFSVLAPNISNLTVVGDELFFAANNTETGTELYKLVINEPIAIDGGEGEDSLVGSEADELIRSFDGDDIVDGGGGNDTLDAGNGDDRLISLAGNDSLFGGNGNDTLNSGDGRDTLNGGNGSDRLTSLAGNDSLFGGNGNDTLNSGIGADTLNGGGGNDLVRGNSGNDFLSGAGGIDILNGGSGRDTLSGDSGDDRLIGGSSNDFLDGGMGFDTLEGGSGDDVFVLRNGEGTDIITDFNLGGDRLGLTDGLQFDDLSFSGNDILSGEEVLASLRGIDTQQLTSGDFREI